MAIFILWSASHTAEEKRRKHETSKSKRASYKECNRKTRTNRFENINTQVIHRNKTYTFRILVHIFRISCNFHSRTNRMWMKETEEKRMKEEKYIINVIMFADTMRERMRCTNVICSQDQKSLLISTINSKSFESLGYNNKYVMYFFIIYISYLYI